MPGSVLPSHSGCMTRHLSALPVSLEPLSSCSGGRRRPRGFGCCNKEGISLPRMDQQCPKGWWGNPTCGPCNCDVNKGFDPDCNKTNGQCHCKVRGSCAHGDVAHDSPGALLILDAAPCPLQSPGSCLGPALCACFLAGSLLSSSVQPSCPSMVTVGQWRCLQSRRAWPLSALAPVDPGVPTSVAMLMGCLMVVLVSPRTSTTAPKAVTPACLATATLWAPCRAPAKRRRAGATAGLGSSGASATAATALLLR